MEDKIIDINAPQEFKILDIYYKSIKFNQLLRKEGSCKLEISHRFEYQKANDLESIRTIITTSIKSDDSRLDFELQTVGIFKIDCSYKVERKYAQIMIDVLYPYLRTEIQLLTTQPGIMPITLPITAPKVQLNDNDNLFN